MRERQKVWQINNGPSPSRDMLGPQIKTSIHTLYARSWFSSPLYKGIKETFKEKQRLAGGSQGPSPLHWATVAD